VIPAQSQNTTQALVLALPCWPATRIRYGATHATWNEGIEQRLRGEWMAAQEKAGCDWEAVTKFMRRGDRKQSA
jgi:hypothetical protein